MISLSAWRVAGLMPIAAKTLRGGTERLTSYRGNHFIVQKTQRLLGIDVELARE